jgi:phosphomevalonate kinase
MRARAPGKVVVSGAYAVLEGAPCLVAAVDRYVEADTELAPDFVTPEVSAALGPERATWFDASALREGDQKLGLGSSAAILVATLAARLAEERYPESDADLAMQVFEPARAAHRSAQGGGSGVDVAASAYGGYLVAELRGDRLETRRVTPPDVHLEVWAAGVPASTAGLLRMVRAFAARDRTSYDRIIRQLFDAAEFAERAIDGGDASDFVQALARQREGLTELGNTAGAPIVTPPVQSLAETAAAEGAVVLPAGAGGGDIVLFAGLRPPTAALRDAAERHGHAPISLALGARGAHVLGAPTGRSEPDGQPSPGNTPGT